MDEAIVFDRRHWWKSFFPFLRRIRSQRFDLVLDLQRHFKSGLISWWSGARSRVGFHPRDAKEFNWLFNNLHIPATGDGISKLDHYLEFAKALGLETRPMEWRLSLDREEERGVEDLLKEVPVSFAAFFVGSKWESKRWFPEKTARCAVELRRRHGLGTVLLGGPEDRDFAAEVSALCGHHCANLAGRTSLRKAVGVLARAAVSIGPDTGLMHLSAAVGTPVVSLWGATNPVRTGPYGYESLAVQGKASCSPCYLRRCPIGRVCMQAIDIEEVVGKVGEELGRKKHGERN
ncbi:MAG: glycosyltransferase family 9 protein [Deltaproteobacteria bacterium]|nr:glycosyltransferase family 9 protein [Deltaproteobacteria bacterium]